MNRTQLQKAAHYALPAEIARSHCWELDQPARDGDALAHIGEQFPGILLTTDCDLQITLAQGSSLAVLEHRANQLVGLPLQELFRTDETQPPPLEVYRRALAGHAGAWERVWKSRTFHGHVDSLVDADGHSVGTITLVVDVTERQRAAEANLLEAIRLEEANKVRSLKTLAGGVAHNFNNLLSAVMGYASLALVELPLDSPVRAMLVEINTAAQCAADLAGQMLLYAMRTTSERSPVNLSRLIESQWPVLQVVSGKKIVLLQDLASDLPVIQGNANQLRSLVLTLIRNAADAIGDGSGTIRLRTQMIHGDPAFSSQSQYSLPEGDYVWLQVSDTGCGMDEETRARIFEPFFSTKFTGRGLGMAAAQGIVHSHQGAIFVSSKPSLGATVHVFLPTEATIAHAASG